MINGSKGITLVSLIITIVVMIIIASITVTTSLDRFEINNLNKMINDIELLESKVSNYYLKYNAIPIVREASNNDAIEYTYTEITFDTNVNDNEVYYILDLKAMDDISLNYGEDGYNNLNSSDDVYIINEKSHSIYYVKGIELDGVYYHSIPDTNTTSDNIPPSIPQIKVISGTKNNDGIYTTDIEIEIIPGEDNWSGVSKTTYSINDAEEIDITTLESNILRLTKDGTYNIIVRTYDNNQNISESEQTTFVCDKVLITETDVQGNILSDTDNVAVYDSYGNKVIVPAGFKITTDASLVTKGIVVEDEIGNQFVWIPVGNIYTTEDTVKTKENTEDITLARYNFNDSGKYEIDTTAIESVEGLKNSTTTNEHAIDIESFIESTNKNGGYYIGRYEARDGETEIERTDDTSDTNLLVCKADNYIYNCVTQKQASNLSKNMYINSNFKSDLINSYAWDTAIVFLQTFDNRGGTYPNYSIQTSINTSISTKGTNDLAESDKICNVYDMASNMFEWTTETGTEDVPCTYRGGNFAYADLSTSYKYNATIEENYDGISFRPILYF